MRKTVLTLSNINASKYFLRQESYASLDLPPYFTFKQVLSQLSKKLLNKKDVYAAKEYDGVNYVLFGNKDGKYAWRKYELVNPLIYTSLVNIITEVDNWNIICKRFKDLRHKHQISCMSVPVLPDYNKKQKASQVSEWINEIEKEAIRLALDYEYVYQTDITDCYGSIYTHSIVWAIHGKKIAKKKRKYDDLLGNKIDHHLQAMSYGQTNGIPQGSLLLDFIAEILLAYADDELFKKINLQIKPEQYHILRYRDDYRIFVRELGQGEIIMKALNEVMIELGLRLNTQKTTRSDEIIMNSIKPDKLLTMTQHFPIVLSRHELYSELLMIYKLGTLHPNCGSIKNRLMKLYKMIKKKHIKGQENELLSILINIALDSPSSFHIIAGFLSKIIHNLSGDRKNIALKKLLRKVNLLPNSGLLEVWLQRIAKPNNLNINFKDKLCKKVDEDKLPLFETRWIADKTTKSIIDDAEYINRKALRKVNVEIKSNEIELFVSLYSE